MSPERLEDSYSVRIRHLQTRTRLVLAKSGLDPSLQLMEFYFHENRRKTVPSLLLLGDSPFRRMISERTGRNRKSSGPSPLETGRLVSCLLSCSLCSVHCACTYGYHTWEKELDPSILLADVASHIFFYFVERFVTGKRTLIGLRYFHILNILSPSFHRFLLALELIPPRIFSFVS